MKTFHILLFFFMSFLFTACQEDASTSSSSASFTAVIHYQGQNCATCHNDVNNSSGVVFQTGGTLFDLINASDNSSGIDLSSYTLRLYKAGITKYSIPLNTTTNGTGNFYTTDMNITDTSYTVEILKDGVVVNRSPATHGAGKEECNSCHTSSGNGTQGRIVEGVSLSRDITPNLCSTCHTVTFAYAGKTPDTANPSNSLLLQNARGSHAGASAVSTTSVVYRNAYEWMREGANNN